MKASTKKRPYVAIGERGLLKVGISCDISKRWSGLRSEFRRKGDTLFAMHALHPIHAAWSVEYALIRYCARTYKQHSGSEWFIGADFVTVVDAAHALWDKWKTHRYPKSIRR